MTHLSKFDDGRVSYLSCFDDDLLVISQWGGPSLHWDVSREPY